MIHSKPLKLILVLSVVFAWVALPATALASDEGGTADPFEWRQNDNDDSGNTHGGGNGNGGGFNADPDSFDIDSWDRGDIHRETDGAHEIHISFLDRIFGVFQQLLNEAQQRHESIKR